MPDTKKVKFVSLLLVLIAVAVLFKGHIARAANVDELKKNIAEKNSELKEIGSKIEVLNKALDETQGQSKTLSREVSKLNGNVNQLKLLIQSSEVTIKKTELELESLGYDIGDVKETITKHRGATGETLRKIQQKDRESVLALFLRNKSLAEGVLEFQGLFDLNSNLSAQIIHLRSLDTQLNQKIEESSEKQRQIKLEANNLKSRKEIVEEEKQLKDTILRETKNKESLYQKQLAELESQQDEISNEIDKIEDELRKSFDPSILPIKRPGVFAWPIKLTREGGIGRITQHFGEVSRLYKGKPHNGLDIGAPVGTPVLAADDGEVVGVDNNDRSAWKKYQYGKYVLIQHDNNLATLYAHLSRQTVRKGDSVKRGDIIGYSGNTGYSTGAHLHFGAYWAPSISFKPIAPAAGLVPLGVSIAPEDYL